MFVHVSLSLSCLPPTLSCSLSLPHPHGPLLLSLAILVASVFCRPYRVPLLVFHAVSPVCHVFHVLLCSLRYHSLRLTIFPVLF